MAELLSSRIGPEAVVEVKEKARVDCEARYGSYVDYAQEDVNALATGRGGAGGSWRRRRRGRPVM